MTAPGFHHPWVTRFGDVKARMQNFGMIASFSSPLPARSVATGDVRLHEPQLDGYRRVPPTWPAVSLLKCRAAALRSFLDLEMAGINRDATQPWQVLAAFR